MGQPTIETRTTFSIQQCLSKVVARRLLKGRLLRAKVRSSSDITPSRRGLLTVVMSRAPMLSPVLTHIRSRKGRTELRRLQGLFSSEPSFATKASEVAAPLLAGLLGKLVIFFANDRVQLRQGVLDGARVGRV